MEKIDEEEEKPLRGAVGEPFLLLLLVLLVLVWFPFWFLFWFGGLRQWRWRLLEFFFVVMVVVVV